MLQFNLVNRHHLVWLLAVDAHHLLIVPLQCSPDFISEIIVVVITLDMCFKALG